MNIMWHGKLIQNLEQMNTNTIENDPFLQQESASAFRKSLPT